MEATKKEVLADPKHLTTFYHLLVNTLFVSVINFTVWFAITFFVYLETKSVFATAIIAGLYLVCTALSGFWLGSLVDHHKKKTMMLVSSVGSLVSFGIALAVYMLAPEGAFKDPASIWLWTLVGLCTLGVIVGNIRTIALPTIVTILIPEGKRDKANGLVGTASGVSFLITSVISGILVGWTGMLSVLILAVVVTVLAMIHLWFIAIPEKGVVHAEDEHEQSKKIDIRGTLKVIGAVPGLMALILFTTFNNFLGGVFMSLLDAYGLSLVSVQVWGILWGVISVGFIVGGLVIAKRGLGKNPLRALMLANVIIWIISTVFSVYSSIAILTVAMLLYMAIMPYIEASEQTILQRVVPYNRQGRVFGFAQSVEQAASPLTAFLIGPLAQFVFIPFMTTGAGVGMIGGWFGTGADRGMALIFILTGIIGLVITLIAFGSKYYRQLSSQYTNHDDKSDTVKPEPVSIATNG
jgi:DHA3 family multidrug efflux protein-like MFS transporter